MFFEDPTPDGANINPFFLAMLGSITRAVANRGLDLLISFQKMEDDWHVRYQDSHRADGLILLGYGDYTLYESRLRQLVESDTQFVRWGSVREDNIGATVGSDNYGAGRLAGDHLIGRGRRKIAFLGQADEHYPEFAERYRGLCEALQQAGIAPDPALQRNALNSEDDGRAAVEALLSGGTKFDAIFAASDLIAIGAMRVLAQMGKRVPQDVAVIGFDDIPAASLTSPPLTTVSQDLKAAGELLIETLLAGIEDRSTPNRVIPARLVVRASTGT
ncbi:MAG: substrate-binding domain-containing protein [Sphingomonadales bacterium]|nr:substrate-binding domain-containing protein [Sphingomonadales bacterium]